MTGFIFIIIGPVLGTILFGFKGYGIAAVGLVPVGFIVGVVPAICSAFTFISLSEKYAATNKVGMIITILLTALAGVLPTLLIWIVLLHTPVDAFLIHVCGVAAATAIICAFISYFVSAIERKYMSHKTDS